MNNKQQSIIQILKNKKMSFLKTIKNMEMEFDNVIDLFSGANKKTEMILMEMQNFYEVTLVIQALKEQKTVFLDLTLVSVEVAQRTVDFLAGGAYAADCEQTCIGESVFVLTPDRVTVSQLAQE